MSTDRTPWAANRRRVARNLLLLPVGAWGLLAAGGYFPTRSLAGAEGLRAMLVAQSLVAAVVIATLLAAMRRMVGRPAADGLKIAMLAGAVHS